MLDGSTLEGNHWDLTMWRSMRQNIMFENLFDVQNIPTYGMYDWSHDLASTPGDSLKACAVSNSTISTKSGRVTLNPRVLNPTVPEH